MGKIEPGNPIEREHKAISYHGLRCRFNALLVIMRLQPSQGSWPNEFVPFPKATRSGLTLKSFPRLLALGFRVDARLP